MVTITRIINGQEVHIDLTPEEIEEVRRQDNIQWAKDILDNYKHMLVDYERIMQDEEQLEMFAYNLNDKCMSNNGELEQEAMRELFTIDEDWEARP